jgi:transcription elongation factor Elf1
LCPRKDHLRVPQWKVNQFRQKGKRILNGPYECPTCKKENLRIRIIYGKKEATAFCECGLERSLKYVSIYDPVDYYEKIVDETS